MFLLGHFAVFLERTGGNFWIYVVHLRNYLRVEGGKREDHNVCGVSGAKTSRRFQWLTTVTSLVIPLISCTFISYEKFFESIQNPCFYFIFQFKYNDLTCERSCVHNHSFVLDKLLLRE